MNERYRKASELPDVVPIFPLGGAILLPRAMLSLNIFEPRYLALVDFALGSDRLIGIVQPEAQAGEEESPAGKHVSLRNVGCVGRITAFNEVDDERYMISLTGLARFAARQEVPSEYPFRLLQVDFAKFASDLDEGLGEDTVDRERLLATLKAYLGANNLKADWERIASQSNERLVNMLSVLCPYGAEEKQALLEAPDLKTRAETLVALAEMELAMGSNDPGSLLQ